MNLLSRLSVTMHLAVSSYVHADANSQCEDCDHRESRRFSEEAKSVANVTKHGWELRVAGCGFVRVLAVVLVPKVGGGYSLNAVTGSIRVARNAGTIQAKNAARPRTPTAVKSATGSVPDTP